MPIHRIRLQGPWEWSLASAAQSDLWSRIKLPDEWGQLPTIDEPVCFRRRFHRPTGIDPGDRVSLAIPTLGDLDSVHLNGESLCLESAEGTTRAAFPPNLLEHNQVVITVPFVDPTRPNLGLGEPVTLEIAAALPHSQVLAEINRRGLVSTMNDTKWHELRNAVLAELPFAPAYQLKLVDKTEPIPPNFEEDVRYCGDWTYEALFPFVEIEWIRIQPRQLRNRGMLIAPEIDSVETELLSILQRYRIPHRNDGRNVWVDGYMEPADPRLKA